MFTGKRSWLVAGPAIAVFAALAWKALQFLYPQEGELERSATVLIFAASLAMTHELGLELKRTVNGSGAPLGMGIRNLFVIIIAIAVLGPVTIKFFEPNIRWVIGMAVTWTIEGVVIVGYFWVRSLRTRR